MTYSQRVRENILPLSVADTLPKTFEEWRFTGNKLVQSRDERLALAAVTALLDRAYGRPVRSVQSEVKTLDMSKLFVLAMKEMRAQEEGAKPVTIDGAETTTTTIDGTEPIDGAAIIEQAQVDREEEGEER